MGRALGIVITSAGGGIIIPVDRIDNLIRCLAHPRNEKAMNAESRLINIGESAVEALIKACDSPNRQVRFRAAFALGRIGDARALDALLKLANDADEFVQYDAVLALGSLGDAGAVPYLVELAKNACDDEVLSSAAVSALRDIGGDDLIEPLDALLESPEANTKESASETCHSHGCGCRSTRPKKRKHTGHGHGCNCGHCG